MHIHAISSMPRLENIFCLIFQELYLIKDLKEKDLSLFMTK